MSADGSLKEWIRREMTLEKQDILVQAKDRVSKLVGLSSDGAVVFRLPAEKLARLTARERILLYMIGKLYAQAAEYSTNDAVTNQELVANLGMPEGTVKPQLKYLRDEHFINSVTGGVHSITRNRVLEALGEIERKTGE